MLPYPAGIPTLEGFNEVMDRY